LRSVTILALAALICLGDIIAVTAQDLPPALGQNAPLSPTNKQNYQDVANQYIDSFARWRNNPTGPGLADRAKSDRNRLIFLAVNQIDLNFAAYQRKTRKRRALWETLLDILEIGASTAISLTNGERAKTVIAEGLGFAQLSRSSINKNFSLRETQILFNKMVAKRAQTLTSIVRKAGEQGVGDYPFEAAFNDLIAYYKAGTIDGALESLNIDTGAEASEATRQLAIVTEEQAGQSLTYAERLAELFTAAKNGNDQEAAGAALKKLKDALKSNLDLTPAGTTAAAIDAMSVTEVESLYRQVGLFLLDHPDKLLKLSDALK
jgi:hypothetical protein